MSLPALLAAAPTALPAHHHPLTDGEALVVAMLALLLFAGYFLVIWITLDCRWEDPGAGEAGGRRGRRPRGR